MKRWRIDMYKGKGWVQVASYETVYEAQLVRDQYVRMGETVRIVYTRPETTRYCRCDIKRLFSYGHETNCIEYREVSR